MQQLYSVDYNDACVYTLICTKYSAVYVMIKSINLIYVAVFRQLRC